MSWQGGTEFVRFQAAGSQRDYLVLAVTAEAVKERSRGSNRTPAAGCLRDLHAPPQLSPRCPAEGETNLVVAPFALLVHC